MTASDIYLMAAGLVGVGIAWERATSDKERAPQASKFIIVFWIVIVAWNVAETWRGFLYLTLMPIGAYKVMEILAAPIMIEIASRRARRERGQSS